ncbi:MAG: cyoD, partial [Alphaproteobacteria bacterium]|nr:cyoD [Alphaproteobacteria bacterium]
MSDLTEIPFDSGDAAPGSEALNSHEAGGGIQGYLIGLFLATALTIGSFYIGATDWVWAPSIPVALIVLAIAQMGVHIVFFLHITTGPDNTN